MAAAEWTKQLFQIAKNWAAHGLWHKYDKKIRYLFVPVKTLVLTDLKFGKISTDKKLFWFALNPEKYPFKNYLYTYYYLKPALKLQL